MIPQSIGGRLKVKGFICRSCNSKTGDKWDAELAKQLNPLNLLCNVKRERSPPPSQNFNTRGGDSFTWNSDGTYSPSKPTFKRSETDEVVKYDIVARDQKEARRMLNGLKKKHPDIDIEDILSQVSFVSDYLDDPIEMKTQIGGDLSGRSIVKTALCMVYASGVDLTFCNLANNYLTNNNAAPCYGYYNEEDLVENREKGVPIHCVAIKSDAKKNLILGYVEFFGAYRMVVCLSDCYKGEDFYNVYSINPVNQEIFDINVDLDFSQEDIEPICNYERASFYNFKRAMSDVIERAQAASFDAERKRVIDLAYAYALEECGIKEGDTIEAVHLEKITQLVMQKLMPFLIHHSKNR